VVAGPTDAAGGEGYIRTGERRADEAIKRLFVDNTENGTDLVNVGIRQEQLKDPSQTMAEVKPQASR